MKSVIVSKFYSTLEKIGFKKHNRSEEELHYLELIDDDEERVSALNDEIDFIINRLKIKMHLCAIVSLILFFLSLNINLWILFSILIPAILFNRLRSLVNINEMVKKMTSSD